MSHFYRPDFFIYLVLGQGGNIPPVSDNFLLEEGEDFLLEQNQVLLLEG